ncbi:MAG TPA: amidohydrolase family protein [Solirubrobacteraceae bacterium]|nr:amidohydrolase family protein [Solirubrobacteraceae bacterium]
MSGAVDVHVHVIVPELLRDVAPGETWRPRVSWDADGQLVELGGRSIRSAVHEFVDIDEILAALARRGCDRALVSPWVSLLFGELEASEALERCRLQNDGLVRLHERRPTQVTVLGSVPLQDPELAANELRELMGRRGVAGVEVTASVAGTYLGHPRFEPFWSAAEACQALVFVHPTTRGFPGGIFDEHYLWNLVGNPFETTVAAAHLIVSGVMARHPWLRVLLAHGGGALPSLAGRIQHGRRAVGAAGPPPGEPAEATMRRFLFDTVTHDPRQLRGLVDAVGADRVLLGSDHPFDMGDPDPVGTVRAAGLSAQDTAALLATNAERELAGAARTHA